MSAFHRAMVAAKAGLEDVSQLFHQSMAKTGSEVIQTHEVSCGSCGCGEDQTTDMEQALAQVLSDFATLRNLLAQAAQTTSDDNAAVAAVHAEDMHGVHELALATTEALKRLQADEVVQVWKGKSWIHRTD
jgi:hypothetical protein